MSPQTDVAISGVSPAELRLKASSFLRLLVAHIRAHWLAYVLAWLCWQMFASNYRVGFNQTPSLPQTVFLIHKNELVRKGDYAAFTVPPDAARHFKNPIAILTKIVVGLPGDEISVRDRVVYVNSVPVGVAKTHSLKGEPLSPLEQKIVPPGHVYVMGLHRDSLDSRYTIVGTVPVQSIVGRAYPLF